jgi:hypothetical protein
MRLVMPASKSAAQPRTPKLTLCCEDPFQMVAESDAVLGKLICELWAKPV